MFVIHFSLSLHLPLTHTNTQFYTDHGLVPRIPFPTAQEAEQGSNCLIEPEVLGYCSCCFWIQAQICKIFHEKVFLAVIMSKTRQNQKIFTFEKVEYVGHE